MTLLERLKELSKQATPGPWYLWGEQDWWENQIDDLTVVASDVDSGDEENSALICNLGAPISKVFTDTSKNPNMANANLIITTINALPDLIAVAAAARKLKAACERQDYRTIHDKVDAISFAERVVIAALAKLEGEAPHDD